MPTVMSSMWAIVCLTPLFFDIVLNQFQRFQLISSDFKWQETNGNHHARKKENSQVEANYDQKPSSAEQCYVWITRSISAYAKQEHKYIIFVYFVLNRHVRVPVAPWPGRGVILRSTRTSHTTIYLFTRKQICQRCHYAYMLAKRPTQAWPGGRIAHSSKGWVGEVARGLDGLSAKVERKHIKTKKNEVLTHWSTARVETAFRARHRWAERESR
jgi:hypothetical protein